MVVLQNQSNIKYLLSTSSSSTTVTTTTTASSSNDSKNNPFMNRPMDDDDDDINVPPISLSSTIKMKNNILALALFSFCVGVFWYSMHAVGQAGDNSDDPLSALKQEAALAQAKHDQEQITTQNTADMLSKFQKGEYDPDHIPDDDDDDQNKKPWYKFW